MGSIKPLRLKGSLQNVYMFNMYFTFPAILGIDGDQQKFMTFLGISTTIPKYTREKEIIRYNNQEVVQPAGKTIEHDWSVKLRMTYGGAEYDALIKWFYSADLYDVLDIQGTARIELLKNAAGDETERVAKKFRMVGIWPEDHPEIGELNQDEKTGLVDIEVMFAFDSMEPGIGSSDVYFKPAGY